MASSQHETVLSVQLSPVPMQEWIDRADLLPEDSKLIDAVFNLLPRPTRPSKVCTKFAHQGEIVLIESMDTTSLPNFTKTACWTCLPQMTKEGFAYFLPYFIAASLAHRTGSMLDFVTQEIGRRAYDPAHRLDAKVVPHVCDVLERLLTLNESHADDDIPSVEGAKAAFSGYQRGVAILSALNNRLRSRLAG